MENEQQIGPFAAFVLLSSATWDVEKCRTNLAEDWGSHFPTMLAIVHEATWSLMWMV
ncbi:hypothetical protein [Anaeromassilibacillus sp. SJQ-1]|uniref:hypothetical protein n=1 Tax=Anaeromassilibacillus sp. SJQ-1 TaxID=3375419 RepID=UPI00398900DF